MGDVIILIEGPLVGHVYANPGSTYPANSVLMLGSYLKMHGFEVIIIDGRNHADYLEVLKEKVSSLRQRIVYVGVTVMTVSVPSALEISKTVKQLTPELPVFWGGSHPTLFPESTLSDPNVDMIAVNEATHASLDAARAITNGQGMAEVNGIGYKDKNSMPVINPPGPPDDFQDIPFFDFSLIDMDLYLDPAGGSVYQREFPYYEGKIRPAPILTGLGCPFKCEFCINVILERKYRKREAAEIIDEIKQLQEKYGINTFIFMDEEFFVKKKRVREFLDLAIEEDLKFNWRMWCRVDRFKDTYLNHELLEKMSTVGHGSLVMGGESGNQEMLNQLNKGTAVEQVFKSLEALQDFKTIIPRYSFMVGMEGESMEQIRDTYDVCLKMKEIRPNVDIAGPFDFRLYPGSPIYNRLVKTHDIKMPEELSDWKDFIEREEISTYTDMPWAPEEFLRDRKYIHFYQHHAMFRPASSSSAGRLARDLLGKMSMLRMKRFFFKIPVEYWLINWIIATRNRMIKARS